MQKQRRRILQPVVHLALEQFLVYLKLPRERQERRTARLFSFVLAFPLILSPLALLYAVGLSPFRLLCCLGLCGSLVQGLDGGTVGDASTYNSAEEPTNDAGGGSDPASSNSGVHGDNHNSP